VCELHKFFKRHIRHLVNLWPPFLGSGIRVRRIDPDWKRIDVEMDLRGWNTNYVGTHYGGSLDSMVDPFDMLMLIENLDRDYIVWDKSASIRFRRPGKSKVFATFRLTDDQIEDICQALTTEEKIDRQLTVEVVEQAGTLIAEVQKQIQIRRKDFQPANPAPPKP